MTASDKNNVKGSPGQKALILLLRKCHADGKPTTIDEVVTKTGWKPSTTRTYLSEGHLAELVLKRGEQLFVKDEIHGLTDEELLRRMSQSTKVRQAPTQLHEPLAAELLKNSADNMVLAIESYNRPSLRNRIGVFCVLYCMSWEQILKSVIVERDGEAAIFTRKSRHGHRETISLRDSLDMVFPQKGSVSENVRIIAELRDLAVHLLVPETQAVMSRMFQSGIINYLTFYREIAGKHLLPPDAAGLVSLVTDVASPAKEFLVVKYGSTAGEELVRLIARLKEAIIASNDHAFAIPMTYSLHLAKTKSAADITLSVGDESSESGTIIERAVSDFKRWKYPQARVVEIVNARLAEALPAGGMSKHGVVDSSGKTRFTSGHFMAIAMKEGWKKSNNKYHKLFPEANNICRYTDEAIDHVVHSIAQDASYLANTMDFTRKARLGKAASR